MGIVIVHVYLSGDVGCVVSEVPGRWSGCCIRIYSSLNVCKRTWKGGERTRGRGVVDYNFFSPKTHALISCTDICNIALLEMNIYF